MSGVALRIGLLVIVGLVVALGASVAYARIQNQPSSKFVSPAAGFQVLPGAYGFHRSGSYVYEGVNIPGVGSEQATRSTVVIRNIGDSLLLKDNWKVAVDGREGGKLLLSDHIRPGKEATATVIVPEAWLKEKTLITFAYMQDDVTQLGSVSLRAWRDK